MKNLSVPIWRLLILRSGDFRAGEKSGYQDNGQTEFSSFEIAFPLLAFAPAARVQRFDGHLKMECARNPTDVPERP